MPAVVDDDIVGCFGLGQGFKSHAVPRIHVVELVGRVPSRDGASLPGDLAVGWGIQVEESDPLRPGEIFAPQSGGGPLEISDLQESYRGKTVPREPEAVAPFVAVVEDFVGMGVETSATETTPGVRDAFHVAMDPLDERLKFLRGAFVGEAEAVQRGIDPIERTQAESRPGGGSKRQCQLDRVLGSSPCGGGDVSFEGSRELLELFSGAAHVAHTPGGIGSLLPRIDLDRHLHSQRGRFCAHNRLVRDPRGINVLVLAVVRAPRALQRRDLGNHRRVLSQEMSAVTEPVGSSRRRREATPEI